MTFNFDGPTDMNSNYGLTIFSLKYEYIVFNFGRVTISRVPIQTAFQEAQAAATDDSSQQRATSPKINIASQKNAAVKQEIQRRYAVEVPYLHEQSLGKKKWSGLEGKFFQKEQMDDLGKKYENQKKDLF